MTPDEPVRRDALRLYTFLKEFTELRTQTVRSLDSYDQVLWLSDIPHEKECVCAAWDRGAAEAPDTWIEIHRPKVPSVPMPPPALQPWLTASDLQDTTLEVPELRQETAVEATDAQGDVFVETRRLEDHPEVKQQWEKYVEQHWWPWREERRRVDPIQSVYTTLFSIYQKQQRLGEQYELVLGLGLLSWRLPSSHIVRRHLIAAHGQIAFDSHRGVISVSPGVEGAKPILEQDMLDPQHRPAPDELRVLTDEVDAIGDEVWDPVRVDSALRGWVQSASPRGTYDPQLAPPDHAQDDPHVQLSPALILRKRTDRSFLRAFDEIISQLKGGDPIPAGVYQFVTQPAQESGTGEQPADVSSDPGDGETYFPLEANDAQRKIVERLATSPGVLVQGPPGTGKSHTIVNLICHLLATGQRVLVTSHTARALAVLQRYIREKVPEVAPLAVVLLGEGRDALQAMEDSVQGITSRQHTWDADVAARRVDELVQQLDEARRQQATALIELRAVRERETYVHLPSFGNYEGTLTQIARRLKAERPRFQWMQPPVPIIRETAALGRLV